MPVDRPARLEVDQRAADASTDLVADNDSDYQLRSAAPDHLADGKTRGHDRRPGMPLIVDVVEIHGTEKHGADGRGGCRVHGGGAAQHVDTAALRDPAHILLEYAG